MKPRGKLALIAITAVACAGIVWWIDMSSKGDQPPSIPDAARKLANDTAAAAPLTPGTTLEFSHAEDSESVIRFVYDKVFDSPRKESPATVIVIYDKSTGSARVLAH